MHVEARPEPAFKLFKRNLAIGEIQRPELHDASLEILSDLWPNGLYRSARLTYNRFMRRVLLFAGLGLVVVAGAVGIGIAVVSRWSSAQEAATPSGSIALNQESASSEAGDSKGQSLGVTDSSSDNSLPVTNNNSNGGKTGMDQDNHSIAVNGGNDSSNNPGPNQTAKGVPGPSDFGQYEQYKTSTTALFGDISVGSGAEAVAGKTLVVNYRGWLTNGTIFDESYARNQPFSFILGQHQVISGWETGMAGMKVGGKRRLIVPPSAGYGNQAVGGIPANSLLVFDVELLDVK